MTTSHDTRPVVTAPAAPPNPPLPAPPTGSRRLWPQLAAGAAIGAALAAVVTLAITSGGPSASTTTPAAPAPVTITAAAPPGPAPLPLDQANRQTCQQGWLSASTHIRSATQAQSAIPVDSILDPAVRANPSWTAAVHDAGAEYRQAADALKAQIAPGASPILLATSNTAVNAFHALGDAYNTFDDLNGNAHAVATDTAEQMSALCTRLAP